MTSFDSHTPTRFVFGNESVNQVGEVTTSLGARSVLLVTDPGIMRAGHADRVLELLGTSGITTEVFSDLHENPSTRDVAAGVELAKRTQPDLILGLGGGSSMDCAKGINFIHSNGGQMKDYWGVGKASRPMLPMIAIPTTAGTGSEAQSFALISDHETHVKMACGDKRAAFRAAILDPTLTLSQPPRVTALTGIDAIAHAIETYVTNRRNAMSLVFSREAWRKLAANFQRVTRSPSDVEARGGMQLGACFAGLAIENSMLGITHSLANPLTANFGIVHGQAIAVMLPHVIRFNSRHDSCAEWYADLAADIPPTIGSTDETSPVELLVAFIEACVSDAGLAKTLAELDVPADAVESLGQQAANEWTANFNPRPATPSELTDLYELALV